MKHKGDPSGYGTWATSHSAHRSYNIKQPLRTFGSKTVETKTKPDKLTESFSFVESVVSTTATNNSEYKNTHMKESKNHKRTAKVNSITKKSMLYDASLSVFFLQLRYIYIFYKFIFYLMRWTLRKCDPSVIASWTWMDISWMSIKLWYRVRRLL